MENDDITIEKLAETSQEQFLTLEKKIDATHSDVKLILSAVENLSGQIADTKQSMTSALDFARLEGRVEALEKQMQKTK